jgi:hypothetical protein
MRGLGELAFLVNLGSLGKLRKVEFFSLLMPQKN